MLQATTDGTGYCWLMDMQDEERHVCTLDRMNSNAEDGMSVYVSVT